MTNNHWDRTQTFRPPQTMSGARLALAVFIGVALTAGAAASIALWHAPMPAEAKAISVLSVAVALLSAAGALWAMVRGASTLRYEVEPGVLRVVTAWGKTEIPLRGARVLYLWAALTLRLMGMGAPGLYVGWYWAGGQKVRVWSTVRNGGLWLDGAETWIVTPEDPGAMQAALLAAGAVT